MTTSSAATTAYDKIYKGEFTAILPREDQEPALELHYKKLIAHSVHGKNEQKRLADRCALIPIIDIKNYRCKAVIDYVVLEIETHGPREFWKIYEVLRSVSSRNPWMDQQGGFGFEPEKYIVRIQDPNLQKIASIPLASLSGYLKGIKKINIREIEISVDFYSHMGGETARQQMVGLLARHYLPPEGMMNKKFYAIRVIKKQGSFIRRRWSGVSGVRRLDQIFPELNDIETPISRGEIKDEIRVDKTISVGNYAADARMKIMEKVADHRNPNSGQADPFDEAMKRSRIEVTLKGEALRKLNITTFESLRKFQFRKLRREYFEFRLITLPQLTARKNKIDTTTAEAEMPLLDIFMKMGVANYQREQFRIENITHRKHLAADRNLGQFKLPVIRNRVGTGHNTNMVAFSELNAKIHDAFRNLEQRISRKGK